MLRANRLPCRSIGISNLLIVAAAGIAQHFELMCCTVVPGHSVIAVVRLVKGQQFAEELRHFVLNRTLSDNNRNRPGSAMLLGQERTAYITYG